RSSRAGARATRARSRGGHRSRLQRLLAQPPGRRMTAPAPALDRPLAARRRSLGSSLVSEAGRFGVPAILRLLAPFLSIARPSSFATWENYRAILNTNSEVVILALGAMLPLIAGEFDLSVPANAGFANVVVLGLTVNQGLPTWAAIVVAIAASALVGVANG